MPTIRPETPADRGAVAELLGAAFGNADADGCNDESRLVDRLRDEVYRLVVSGAPLPTSGLVAHWRLDEGGGVAAHDSSGNGLDAALINGPVWRPGGGRIGGALQLDGTDDYVDRDLVTTARDNVSMAVWVRWDGGGSPTSSPLAICNGNSATSGYGLWPRKLSDWAVVVECGGVGAVRSSTVINVDTWYYLAAVRGGGTWNIYVNGSMVSTTGNPTPNTPAGRTTLAANQVGAQTFSGLLDDARIYDRSLTLAEVEALASGILADVTGNALDSDGNGSEGPDFTLTFTLDKPPVVKSIALADPSPTNATSVDFTVTFDQDVTGVDDLDFDLTVTDSASGSVAGVVGSGSVYTVTVDTVTGTGTLRLDLVDDGSIQDGTGNALAGSFSSGEAYDIDNTAPVVQSITLADPDPTNATSLSFTLTFSEGITGLNAGDLQVALSGTTGGLFSITPAGVGVYTVTVTASGDGTVGLNLVDDNTITDGAGHALGGPAPNDGDYAGPTYTVDTVPPDAPSVGGPVGPTTNTQPAWTWLAGSGGVGEFRYGFTEGNWIGNDVPDVSYTPSAPLADGTWTLYVQERDDLGNWSDSGSYPVTIDTTGPVVTVDVLFTSGQSPPISGTIDDAAATVSVTVGGNSYPAMNNGPIWTLADGDITPDLAEGTYDAQVMATDALSNSSSDGTTNELVIDLTPPTVTVDAFVTNDTTPPLSGTVDDAAATIQVTVAGTPYAATSNGTTWTLTDGMIAPALAAGTYDIQATATDPAGNVGTDGSAGELVIDTVAPVVTVNTLTTGDKTPPLSGTVNDPGATIQVAVGGNSYAATNSGATWLLADGTISPALAEGTHEVQVTATDTAGNVGTDATMDELEIVAVIVVVEEEDDCAAGTGGERFALLLPLALALAALKRRRARTSASVEGGVGFVSRDSVGYADVECFNSGEIVAAASDGSGVSSVEEWSHCETGAVVDWLCRHTARAVRRRDP
ncbi:MAG: Ig-like domain-containing protein [Planctomycetota bacterium]